ncbi:MAG: type II secretion system protein GspF [Legionellales bacterium RIFCSPHIGHO2_12_FULL_42_9]|nr:MAG: type II secretion system protein GspF [Legionellales bacterium RIFCSPHIGHO2_12_FULL_42_9]
MGSYKYHAVTKVGDIKTGILTADSEKHVRQILRKQELTPMQIKELIKHEFYCNNKLTVAELALITRQLATMLKSSIPIAEALQAVSDQAEKNKIKKLMLNVKSKVLEGYALAQAMGELKNIFPDLYRATIAAGEQTGNLDLVLEKLANYIEKQQLMQNKIQQALIYPSLMLVVSMTIVSFLLTFIVPKIIEVFNNTGQSLPLTTKILIELSAILTNYGVIILIVLGCSIIIFKHYLKNLTFKNKWHACLLKLPIFSNTIKLINTARYMHTFSILFSAGVNVLDSMRIAANLITNVVIGAHLHTATQKVQEGSNIHQALKIGGFFNPISIYLIASGEKSGQLADLMERAATYLDQEINRLIEISLALLEPCIILLMGGVVLFIVLATLLPIFSMEQLVL